jgi:hypothetical protein
MGEITLNAQVYKTQGEVLRVPVIEFSQPFRTTTIPDRSDRLHTPGLEFTHLLYGFGCNYDDMRDPLNRFRFTDSNIMTHWRGQRTLNFLDETSTNVVVTGHTLMIRKAVEFKGDFWGIFALITGASAAYVRKYTGSSTTWNAGGGILANTAGLKSVGDASSTGMTITVTIDGTATVLTEGVNWTANANLTTQATNIKNAITAVTGMSATSSGVEIYVTQDDATRLLTVATSRASDVIAQSPSQVIVPLAIAEVANHLVALTAGGSAIVETGGWGSANQPGEKKFGFFRSTDGATWSKATTPARADFLSNEPTGGEDIDAGGLAVVGTNLFAVLWDEVNNNIDVWKSTDSGDNYGAAADNAGGLSGSVKNVVSGFPDLNGDDSFVVITEAGVYAYDISESAWQLIRKLPIHTHNGRGATLHNGKLYVSLGYGGCIEIEWAGEGVYNSQFMGPNLGDGLPTSKQGYFSWLLSSEGFLVGGYGGHASGKNGTILLWNTLGWHCIFQNTTQNERPHFGGASAADDDTKRLHYADRTGTTPMHHRFFATPFNNPVDGGTYKYQLNGDLTFPEQAAGLPEIPCAWLVADIDAVELTAGSGGSGGSGDEFIEFKYGKTGESTTANDLGDFLSGVKTLKFPASSNNGTGESTKTILPYVNLDRSTTNTKSPILRALILSYRKVPATRYAYRVVVDVSASMRISKGGQKAIITDLESAQDSVVQVAFKYADKASVNVVSIPQWEWHELTRMPHTPSQSEARDPVVVLHLVELVAA